MRAFYAFLLLIAGCLSVAQAQDTTSVHFDVRYLPETSYQSTDISHNTITLTLTGTTPAARAKLAKNGMGKPVIMQQDRDMQASFLIGKANNANEAPAQMTIQKFQTSQTVAGKQNVQTSPVADAMMYGRCKADGKLQIDSVGGKMEQSYKQAFMQAFNSILNQTKFPDKQLKTGESFTLENPITIPFGTGQGMRGIVKVTFTLKSIAASKAYLDIKQVVAFNIQMGNVNTDIKATGSGAGKMIYDIDRKFAISNTTTLAMNMSQTQSGILMNMKMAATSTQNAIITDNK